MTKSPLPSSPHPWTFDRILRGPSGAVRVGWKLLAFAALLTAFGVGHDKLLRSLNHGVYPSLPIHAGELAVVILASWLLLRLEGRPLVSLGLRLDRRWLGQFGIGFLLACGLMGLAVVGVAGTQGGWERTALGPGVLLQGLSGFLGVAAFEELVCRGYPFQRMVEAWGEGTTQALMALCFIAPHLLVGILRGYSVPTLIMASLNIGCAAVMLGVALLRTGSLALPIGLHLGWNWMQGTVLGLGVSGGTPPSFLAPRLPGQVVSLLTGGRYGPEAGLPGLLAVLAGTALILWASRSRRGASYFANRP